MKFLDGLSKLLCGHPELTPEDGEGYALCVCCGGAVPVRFTAKMLDDGMRALRDRRI